MSATDNLTPHARNTARISQAAEKRKADWLQFRHAGHTVAGACQEVGVALNTYQRWRQRDPEFAARADLAGQRARGDASGFNGTLQDFERAFIPSPEGGRVEQSFYTAAIHRALEGTREGEITLVLLPPGARKTTTLENWAVGKLATDPNHRILNISKSLDHAKKSVGRMQALLTDTSLTAEMIARFGPFKEYGQEKRGKPWAQDHFTVATSTLSHRDYSMTARGWTSQIYGSRADTIIIDDPQTIDDVDQTEKKLDKLRLDIFTRRPGPGRGRVVILGTRLDHGDLYERLIEEDVVDHYLKFPVVDGDGEPVDPVVFPKEHLPKVRKQVGEQSWAAAYMMRPKLGENATFPSDALDECKQPAMAAGPLAEHEQAAPVVIGVDPNLGAGYTSLCALAYWPDRARVLDSHEWYGLSRTEDILDRLERWASAYRPVDVRIEINAFQRGLQKDERLRALAREYGFSIREHTTDKKKVSHDLEQLGIATMARSFLKREIEVPWHRDGECDVASCSACHELPDSREVGWTRRRMEPLVQELEAWRPVRGSRLKQDRVMSLWIAWIRWQQMRPTAPSDDSQWDRPTGWKPVAYTPLTSGRR
ncbi:hypothetical protein ER308_07115 [Egibacter rhizosphaerae]|uniref:Terminase large subunit gp17-like C-terminal domain-containing protein n=1 Tax=Egibacter rhizosphaerae TaxID=1670831 RepID=A0A411YDT4_9ACTN|nr:hypothetical protein [Egibacter rhizosphaerae]QBI19336.1 hypothetical protein ER308_07115 [Egibacter rhizosphaerae]